MEQKYKEINEAFAEYPLKKKFTLFRNIQKPSSLTHSLRNVTLANVSSLIGTNAECAAQPDIYCTYNKHTYAWLKELIIEF